MKSIANLTLSAPVLRSHVGIIIKQLTEVDFMCGLVGLHLIPPCFLPSFESLHVEVRQYIVNSALKPHLL